MAISLDKNQENEEKNMNKKGIVSSLLAMTMIFGLTFSHTYSVHAEDAVEDVTEDTVESVPELTVTSDILGLADTGNKSTLKYELIKSSGPGDTNLYYYDDDGNRVIYEDQLDPDFKVTGDTVTYTGSAILSLGDGIDDSLIDSSHAVVKLIDGNGYYAEEFVLSDSASKLSGTWENGKLIYTLDEGDLEWNTWDYYVGMSEEDIDLNSGREWSMMGGDGNGVYFFTLEVSGIEYDGQEVPAAKIPFAVYIYGRSSADLGIGTEFIENTVDEDYSANVNSTDDVQWVWYTGNQDSVAANEPYLNDTYTDYFTIVWPEGTDASSITAEDVTVTLKSVYGDEYVLSEETKYGEHEYAVISREGETVVAVTYQQWAYVPVYSTMTIDVNSDSLQASQTYDISSVTAYGVQTGGGGLTVDHTVTCQNYYGITGLTNENAVNNYYTLSTVIDGTTYYYAEVDGKGTLVEGVETSDSFGFTSISAPANAWHGDASEYHIAVINNVVFYETRTTVDTTETKTVDGEEIEFTINVSPTKTIAEMLEAGAQLVPGYNLNGSNADKWAWTYRYQAGWTTDTPEPTSLPYPDIYPFGYEAGGSNSAYDNIEVSGPGGIGGGTDIDPDDVDSDDPQGDIAQGNTDQDDQDNVNQGTDQDSNQNSSIIQVDETPTGDVDSTGDSTPADVVNTSDSTMILPYAVLAVCALTAGVVIVKKYRHE